MLRKILWIATFTTVFVAGFLWISRSMLYNYNVDADYSYDFVAGEVFISRLEINDEKITLPADTDGGKSSFLKVNVNSSFFGNFIRPSVEMAGPDSKEIQFFEHGASGTRYLNVSKLISRQNREIILSGNYISIENGSVELVQFKNPALEEKRILVLAPHPDDAEIAAFGLYSSQDDIYIVTVTSGDAGPFMYDEIYSQSEAKEHYLKKGEVRTWNSLAVPMLGGVHPENILNLGYNDARLRAMYRDREMVAEGLYTAVSDMNTFRSQNRSKLSEGLKGINNWDSLVENMVYLLNEIKPDIIIAPSPMLDQHSDHQYTTIAAIEALKKLDRKDGHMLLYTNHQVEFNERFPYGDAGAVISLPPTPKGSNYFRRIFSYPMDGNKQRDKIFALDAMNDLRLGTDYRFVGSALAQVFETFWMQITGRDETYFRRAIRSNEFFFVVDIADIYDNERLSRF